MAVSTVAETAIGNLPPFLTPAQLIKEYGIETQARSCSCKKRSGTPGKLYAIVYDDDTTAFLCSRCDVA